MKEDLIGALVGAAFALGLVLVLGNSHNWESKLEYKDSIIHAQDSILNKVRVDAVYSKRNNRISELVKEGWKFEAAYIYASCELNLISKEDDIAYQLYQSYVED